MMILVNDFKLFLLATLFCAIGTSLKGLSETQMLYSSLKPTNRTREFARIEGKSVSRYYYIEGVCSVFVGYLYTLNAYLPICITVTLLIIAFLVSLKFDEIKAYNQDGNIGVKEYIKDFKLVLSSKRIISIFLYAFCMSGIVGVMATLQKSIIVDLNVNATLYSVIFAILFITSPILRVDKIRTIGLCSVLGVIMLFILLNKSLITFTQTILFF